MDVLSEGRDRAGAGDAWEVFVVALGLGLTAFGGPVAHLGYFERTYVERRRWLSAEHFSGLVALCQMLPGPASSQVGFLIGHARAGWAGAAAAWFGFTLPSALIMFAFAIGAPYMKGLASDAAFHGLQLAAVAVVAQALGLMGRRLAPDLPRTVIALCAALFVIAYGAAWAQIGVLAAGGAIGAVALRGNPMSPPSPAPTVGRRAGLAALATFGVLLAASLVPLRSGSHSPLTLAAAVWRAGALVFGGGHVVLPLLRGALVPAGWLSDANFMAGYGATQALPGPLFSFAAFVGAAAAPSASGVLGQAAWSALALAAIFLPGLLLAAAGASIWGWVGRHSTAQGALAGVNAAVVGVLAAALYSPVWTSAVHGLADLAIVFAALLLLMAARWPPLAVVAACVVGASAQAAIPALI